MAASNFIMIEDGKFAPINFEILIDYKLVESAIIFGVNNQFISEFILV